MGLMNNQQISPDRLPFEVAEALLEGVPVWIEVVREGKGPCGGSKKPRFGHAIRSIELVHQKTRRQLED
jgi:hypothetical protein